MRLSVIIINYKTGQLVLDCLSSLYKFDTTDTEIFVVDNNSNDGIEALLRENYPSVIFIQTGYNAGFSRANNAAIRKASGEHILLLNSDTVNLDDAANKCSDILGRTEYAAAGVQLLNADGTPQISGNFAMRGGLNYLLPLPYVGSIIKRIAGLFKIKKAHVPEATGITKVDWINGAFLMVKKNIIERAGLMDEDFFLYAEEAEWCHRLRKFGPLCIAGDLHVLHLQGESAGTAFDSETKGYHNLFDKKGLQIMLSNFLRIRKEFGAGWFLFQLVVYYLTAPFFFLCTCASLLFSRKPLYRLADVKGFFINLGKMLKYIPKILFKRPFFYKVL